MIWVLTLFSPAIWTIESIKLCCIFMARSVDRYPFHYLHIAAATEFGFGRQARI
jgi:hypothetical protein